MPADFNALEDLSIFIGSDQPETCRKCGARTNFDEVAGRLQLHDCLQCANRYIVEFED